jgi:hypothetical protein
MKKLLDDWYLIGFMCLSIGLAPFSPEPHIWGKIKWVMGGAIGMQPMDWGDLLLHGFPYLLLVRLIVIRLLKNKKQVEG